MVVLNVINLPPVLPLALVASGLCLVGDAIRLPQSRGAFPSDTPADLKKWHVSCRKVPKRTKKRTKRKKRGHVYHGRACQENTVGI